MQMAGRRGTNTFPNVPPPVPSAAPWRNNGEGRTPEKLEKEMDNLKEYERQIRIIEYIALIKYPLVDQLGYLGMT